MPRLDRRDFLKLLGAVGLHAVLPGTARAQSIPPYTGPLFVSVSARDQATGREQSITVNATGTLSDEEIQTIIEENELYEVQIKDSDEVQPKE